MSKKHFEPYISADKSIPEFSFQAVLLGALFGIIFGATTVYLGLKVGLTVSASIPIAVLAISVFKKLSHSTILENNIVQTVGSAGESVAAGVVFTLPALLFLPAGKEYFHYFQIFVLALTGGLLGVFFMVPLRKILIVQEHERLPYPEGTACADVLIAGEKGGGLAKKVYYGIGIAFIYKILMSIFGLWKDIPTYVFGRKSFLPNGRLSAEITPELLGVGYIIGIRISSLLFAGGVLSALVLTPLITYIGDYAQAIIPPGTKLISEMTPNQIWSQYIRYIGAGAVTFAGIMTMIRTIPTIITTVRQTLASFKKQNHIEKETLRTDKDLSFLTIVLGSIALITGITFLPNIPITALSAIMIVVAGLFFVTVSSRIVGLIGTSSNPISGMTIATLMGTCLIFVAQGMTGEIYQPIALCVGAIVAIAAANAGATSQDLKTGFLVGSTPIKQQIGMMIGVLVSAIAIGWTVMLLNDTVGLGEITDLHPHPLPAPQATLMATIIKGLLDQSLPWGLVLVGMGISAVVELCGVSSLAFAVGSYLPMSTTAPIFIGGVIRWITQKILRSKPEHSELESGTLYSSGLIAGGALTGILVAVFIGTSIGVTPEGKSISLLDKVSFNLFETMGGMGDIVSIIAFLILGASLLVAALRKADA